MCMGKVYNGMCSSFYISFDMTLFKTILYIMYKTASRRLFCILLAYRLVSILYTVISNDIDRHSMIL